MQIQFDDIILNVRPSATHEWGLTTADVAAGFGVSESNVREHKRTKPDELVENKHYVSVRNPDTFNNQEVTYWTKRGVVRLGFLIGSVRAKRFRDWADDLIVKTVEQAPQPAPVRPSYEIADPIERAKVWIREQEATQALRFENAELKPLADYASNVLDSSTALVTTKIALELGMSARKLNKLLAEKGVQYFRSGMWNLTARYNGLGYAKLATFHHTGSDGKARTEHSLVWTERGRQFIRQLLSPALPVEVVSEPAYLGTQPGIA